MHKLFSSKKASLSKLHKKDDSDKVVVTAVASVSASVDRIASEPESADEEVVVGTTSSETDSPKVDQDEPKKPIETMNPSSKNVAAFAQQFAQHLDIAATPFQCVAHISEQLQKNGFSRLLESNIWGNSLVKGGKYFYTRNSSTLVAFTVGGAYEAGNGFKVIGAHTDSPVLKIKPISKITTAGYLQVGVECYGGGLWHTWFDRDLGLAGRVIVRNTEGKFEQRLVHIKKPILRTATLCIHLQSAEERSAFKVNKETNLTPILGMVAEELNGKGAEGEQHSSLLMELLATELNCKPTDIVDLELSLTDTQPAAIGGARDEFVFGPRMDNQMHSFTSSQALIEFANSDALANDTGVSIIALFDHEEVGSDSAMGAGSPIMRDAVVRISECFAMNPDNEIFKVALSKSMLLSADGSHAVHPNYVSKHESNHQPKLNKGTVIKTNQNQRYATNAITGFVVRELARRNNLPIQEFVVRNDCPCGSTIGPIIAHNTGIQTIDIGIPQLSMHSIRETCGVVDLTTNKQLMVAFLKDGLQVLADLGVEGV